MGKRHAGGASLRLNNIMADTIGIIANIALALSVVIALIFQASRR